MHACGAAQLHGERGRGRERCGHCKKRGGASLTHVHRAGDCVTQPENLLLDNKGYLKLIDFGFAKWLPVGASAFTLCGTPYYFAPEMILHCGHGRGLDWWTMVC